jgi:hypothetical protein
MPSMCKLKIDELECTLADEEAAHQETLRMLEVANADAMQAHWYRLLALAFSRDIFCRYHSGSGWYVKPGRHAEDDADGLPVRTLALEAALRQALEESK